MLLSSPSTKAKNAWGDAAGSFENISDILFQTVKKGVTTFPELAKALGNVAGTASQAGISMQETMAAFAALTKVTKSSNISMTYLRNLIVAIIR